MLNNELIQTKSNNAKTVNDNEQHNKNNTFNNNKMISEKIDSEVAIYNELQNNLTNQIENLNQKNDETRNCKNMITEENVQVNNDVLLLTNKN